MFALFLSFEKLVARLRSPDTVQTSHQLDTELEISTVSALRFDFKGFLETLSTRFDMQDKDYAMHLNQPNNISFTCDGNQHASEKLDRKNNINQSSYSIEP